MSQMLGRAVVIIFPFGEKKKGGKKTKNKMRRSSFFGVFFFQTSSRIKCLVGGIYFPGTLGHDVCVGGRWINAPNAFVIIKSGAGRPVKREGGGSAWEQAHQQHEGLLLMTHLIIQEMWVP